VTDFRLFTLGLALGLASGYVFAQNVVKLGMVGEFSGAPKVTVPWTVATIETASQRYIIT
jgi:hypothetical protein